MCKNAVKKLSYLLRYVPDQYKTQQMCDEAILENDGTFNSFPYSYKSQEMCIKATENYFPELEFVPEFYKAQKLCDKPVNTYPSTITFVSECFMTQLLDACLYLILFLINIKLKKYVTLLHLNTPSLIEYCPDKYETHRMFDSVVSKTLLLNSL